MVAIGGGTLSSSTGVAGGGFSRQSVAHILPPGSGAPDELALPLVRYGVAVATASVLGADAAEAPLGAVTRITLSTRSTWHQFRRGESDGATGMDGSGEAAGAVINALPCNPMASGVKTAASGRKPRGM